MHDPIDGIEAIRRARAAIAVALLLAVFGSFALAGASASRSSAGIARGSSVRYAPAADAKARRESRITPQQSGIPLQWPAGIKWYRG